MIDCFVLAGVKTFSQRGTLPTREVVAALSVPCFTPSLSPAFSGISASYRRADNLLASSCTPALSAMPPHTTHRNPSRSAKSRARVHVCSFGRPLLLISLIYLYFFSFPNTTHAYRIGQHVCFPPTRSSPYLHIIYFIAISQDVENRTVRLVTRLQLLNYAAIICLFLRLSLSLFLFPPQLLCQRVVTFSRRRCSG